MSIRIFYRERVKSIDMTTSTLRVGQVIYNKGCFTEEYFLRGLSGAQIGRELGLPPHRLVNGLFISFAIQLPAFHEFKLGGWAKYSTDNFVTYRKRKMKWSEAAFERTYEGKRMPISIEEAKKGWLAGMRNEKLIKVIPNIPRQEGDEYPQGGKASQIIVVHPIRCQVTNFLQLDEVFRGVWH